MIVSLSVEIASKVRGVYCAVDGLHHTESWEFREELKRLQAELEERWRGRTPSRIPLLEPARELYRSVGMDPTRHRPSSEALLRRIMQSKGLYRLDPIVDTGNLFSLASGLPLGLYDREFLRGDVSLRLGRTGESFAGIRKGTVNVDGRLCLADEEGPFGSPSSDSHRCRIREETTRILFVVYAPAGYDAAELLARGEELARNFERWNGGVAGDVRPLAAGATPD